MNLNDIYVGAVKWRMSVFEIYIIVTPEGWRTFEYELQESTNPSFIRNILNKLQHPPPAHFPRKPILMIDTTPHVQYSGTGLFENCFDQLYQEALCASSKQLSAIINKAVILSEMCLYCSTLLQKSMPYPRKLIAMHTFLMKYDENITFKVQNGVMTIVSDGFRSPFHAIDSS